MTKYYSADQDRGKPYVSGSEYSPFWFNSVLTLPTPVHSVAYFDWLMVRLDRLPTARDLAFLRHRCASVGDPLETPDGATYIRLARPQRELLADLPPEIAITSGEISLDLAFANQADLWLAEEIAAVHGVAAHHRADQHLVRSPGRFAYRARKRYADGKRRAVVAHHYVERESRCLPGSGLPTLHLEFRLSGSRATTRAGISTTADAARFDHRQFWSDKLRLVSVDPLRFGRWLVRQGWTCGDRTGDDLARRLARAYLSQFDTIQAVVDHCRCERILTPVSAALWLPVSRRRLYARVIAHASAHNAPAHAPGRITGGAFLHSHPR